MRASLSKWSLMLATAACMSLVGVTGCKSSPSAPGADWLSWGKKPSPTSISSSGQRKPSTSALPGPSATTAASNSLASYPNFNQSGGSAQANKGYRTGPYGTGSNSTADSAAGSQRFAGTAAPPASGTPYGSNPYAGNSYPGTPAGSSNSYAAAPYQSPYQSTANSQNQSPGGGATPNRYATADSRNSLYSGTQSAGSAPAAGTWGSPQARADGDSFGGVAPAGHSAAGSYSQPYQTGAGSTSPATGYPSAAPAGGDQWTGNRTGGLASGTPAGSAPRGGGYQPGSTARDSNLMPAGEPSASPLGAAAGQSSPGGSNTRPSTYPTGGTTSPYGGGNYSYPSTGR